MSEPKFQSSTTQSLDDTKKKLLQGFVDYLNSQDTLCVDNQNVMAIMPKLLKLQNEKGNIYGRSWCKHEDMSAYFQLERKFDRISNIMERAMKKGTDIIHSDASSTPTETFLDTIVDLGLYSLMWAGLFMEKHPDEFQKFLEANNLIP